MTSQYSDLSYLSGAVGRWNQVISIGDDVRALSTGMDFREPRYRREVFMRFYQHHLRWRTHPGCVYFLMPYLADAFAEPWDMERKLWFAFINGCTQNPVTSLTIMRNFPYPLLDEEGLQNLDDWFNGHWDVLPFDTDRRYQKKDFPAAVRAYHKWLDGRMQISAFCNATQKPIDVDPEASFDDLWKMVAKNFVSFGRLSTWSYLEYLFIAGLPLEPSSMMLTDMSGSKSHRNGLTIVLGRDDLDWRKDTAFQGKYTKEQLAWLESEADNLLKEMRERLGEKDNHQHISRFTLESALCTYKGWHRPNRRYANVYSDMLYDRIKQAERLRPNEDFSVFWEARAACLSPFLRLEDNPDDPGLQRIKQNHYRLTGQVIMMDEDWAVFRNDNSWRVGR